MGHDARDAVLLLRTDNRRIPTVAQAALYDNRRFECCLVAIVSELGCSGRSAHSWDRTRLGGLAAVHDRSQRTRHALARRYSARCRIQTYDWKPRRPRLATPGFLRSPERQHSASGGGGGFLGTIAISQRS